MGLFSIFKKKPKDEFDHPPGFYKGYYIAKQEGRGIKISSPEQSSKK